MQPPPPITRALLIACTVLLFAAQIPTLAALMDHWLALHPVLSGFWPWQMLTFSFVPVNVWVWLFNMMLIYYFGSEMEAIWGERRMIQFVLASALVGAAVYLLLSLVPPLLGAFMPTAPMIDASAIAMGLLVAAGILFPHRPIRLYLVLEVTQRVAVWICVGVIAFMTLGEFSNGSGAWARGLGQLGGALGGYLMILYWRWRPPSRKRPKPPSHIRRVH